jgi:murein DD-endopeptidase MepM/ murein hydrolase activator NlpD
VKTLFAVLLVVLAAGGLGVAAVSGLRVGPAPELELIVDARAIGPRLPVRARATAAGGRGLAGLRLELEQQGRVRVVASRQHEPPPALALFRQGTLEGELAADVGHAALPELVEGEAVLRAVAERAPTWLRRPSPVVRELRLPVRKTPPTLALLSTQHYVMQGGSGLVVYRVSDSATADYVRAGDWRFPGVPSPSGAKGERVALFGIPWDEADASRIRVVAEDDAGNTASLAFVDRFAPKPPARDTIPLEPRFLEKVTTEIRERTPGLAARGSLIEDYLAINRELRAANADELRRLSRDSAPAFLWHEAFAPLRGGKVMSAFADRRSYVFEGREVDQQTHLGFDLAAVAHSPVLAPNRGQVRLARYFGIYGNAVVLDHGLGLLSLSAHLSSIDVAEGQTVERGDVLGRTGATGLAGGDHLHFTTLVRGLPVNPIEWWDEKWIRDRVLSKLPPAVSP